MEILLLCGIYLVELACYQLGIRILFEVRQKSWIWMGIGIFIPVIIGILPINVSGKNVFVTVGVISVVFVSLDGKIKEKGVKLVLTLLLLACIDDVYMHFCEGVLAFDNNNLAINANYLVVKCCSVLSIIILNIFKSKMNYYMKTYISSAIYLVLGIIAASMIFCLDFFDQIISHLDNQRYILFCNILIFIILVNIFLLVIFVIYIKNTHERMEQMLKTEKMLKESQVSYYK